MIRASGIAVRPSVRVASLPESSPEVTLVYAEEVAGIGLGLCVDPRGEIGLLDALAARDLR